MKRVDVNAVLQESKKLRVEEVVEAALLAPEGILTAGPDEGTCYARIGNELELYGVKTGEKVYQLRVGFGRGEAGALLELRPQQPVAILQEPTIKDNRSTQSTGRSLRVLALWPMLYLAKLVIRALRKRIERAIRPLNRAEQLSSPVITELAVAVAAGRMQGCGACNELVYMLDEEKLCLHCRQEGSLTKRVIDICSDMRNRGWKAGVVPVEVMLLKYLEARGRCAYSDRRIRFENFSNWQASPERIDSHLPYSKDNVVWVARIFNVMEPPHGIGQDGPQWSRDKFLQVKQLRSQPIDEELFLRRLAHCRSLPEKALFKSRKAWPVLNADVIDINQCVLCKKVYKSEVFRFVKNKKMVQFDFSLKSVEHRSAVCPTCEDSMAVGLISKLQSIKANQRPKLSQLLDQLEAQSGRCAVSNIPLSFAEHTNWRFCLRRIDVNVGWVPGNMHFICLEFNILDSRDNPNVSPQWTTDMMNEIWPLD